jgi:hypothetical protein
MYCIEYTALNYYHSPISNECICLGLLFHNVTTGQRDFKYISNFKRYYSFDDEADVEFVKLYLKYDIEKAQGLNRNEEKNSLDNLVFRIST